MAFEWIYSLSALAALVPLALLPLVSGDNFSGRGIVYWSAIAVAATGPLSWCYVQLTGGWSTGLSMTLWFTIAASIFVFAVVAAWTRHGFRLTVLLAPYLLLLALIATVLPHAPERPLTAMAPGIWLGFHIGISVLTYALITVAAIAGLAVALQERALKAKHPTRLSHQLPSVADGEALQVGLLGASFLVLGAGILSGMANQYFQSGAVLVFNHKTLFTLSAFAVISALLLVHYRFGVGGRRVARIVLLAYLLLTIGYPGVKFVTDVIMG